MSNLFTLRVPPFDTVADKDTDDEKARIMLHACQEASAKGIIQEGYTHLKATFSGSGDSTDSLYWEVYSSSGVPVGATVDVVFDENLRPPPADPLTIGGATPDDIDDWVWNMSTDRHGGWYNNEGGYGNLTINFVDGLVEFEMFEYVQRENRVESSMLVDLPGEAIVSVNRARSSRAKTKAKAKTKAGK